MSLRNSQTHLFLPDPLKPGNINRLNTEAALTQCQSSELYLPMLVHGADDVG